VSLNERLDRLPRAYVGRGSRSTPAYRACGQVGTCAGVVVLAAAGLLGDRPLGSLAVVALAAFGTLFGWAYVRRALTGRERLVLLEHVWVALAAAAGAAWALDEPVAASLDALAPALWTFLAAGRVGCLLAGCCHGRPATVGIRYPAELVAEGFPPHLVGIRLLPVQLLEAVALASLAAAGLVALPFAGNGVVLAGTLAVYAVVRFGLEHLRGDRRPQLLGLSRNQWTCLIQLAVAILLADGPNAWPALALLGASFALGLTWRHARDRHLLADEHVAEVRALARERPAESGPAVGRTSRGTLVGASWQRDGTHLSLSVADGPRDLERLCALAARAVPQLDAGSARVTGVQTLHVLVPASPADGNASELGLYRAALRSLEHEPAASPERAAYFGVGV
jgi:prolipoprotein diacylglyceryl transferase